jgi:D-aspartate ligase
LRAQYIGIDRSQARIAVAVGAGFDHGYLAGNLMTSAAPGALVLDSNPGGLAVVRSLGRHNIPVWAFTGRHRLASLSRYCTRSLRWPIASEQDKAEWLKEVGRRHKLDGWVLFSASDETARLVSRNRGRLGSQYRLTTPEWEVMRWAYDKRLTYQLASDLGVSHPKSFFPRNRKEVESIDFEFPVVLKPAYRETFNRFTQSKAWLARDRSRLLELYDSAVLLVDPSMIIIQELIDGGGKHQFSFACLCLQGRSVGSLVARRTRQYPVDFGYSSSFVETIELPEIETVASHILGNLRYSGVAELEFKYDPKDQKFKLLDINARFWTWHSLGARAGVEFPYLLWKVANDQSIEEVRARGGFKWVHMTADLLAAIEEVSRGRLSIREYVRSVTDTPEFAIFSRDDIVPALLEIPLFLLKSGRRFVRTH